MKTYTIKQIGISITGWRYAVVAVYQISNDLIKSRIL